MTLATFAEVMYNVSIINWRLYVHLLCGRALCTDRCRKGDLSPLTSAAGSSLLATLLFVEETHVGTAVAGPLGG